MIRKLKDGHYVCAQISATSLPQFAEQGIRRIVNNRPDGEEPGQPTSAALAAAAQAVRLGYAHLPVAGGLEPETIEAARSILGSGEPTLLFCRSGTRSAMLWAAAMVADGEPVDAVLAATHNAGFDFSGYRPMLDAAAAAVRAG